MTYEEAQRVIYEMTCVGHLSPKEKEALHIAYQILKERLSKKPIVNESERIRMEQFCKNYGQVLDREEEDIKKEKEIKKHE